MRFFFSTPKMLSRATDLIDLGMPRNPDWRGTYAQPLDHFQVIFLHEEQFRGLTLAARSRPSKNIFVVRAEDCVGAGIECRQTLLDSERLSERT